MKRNIETRFFTIDGIEVKVTTTEGATYEEQYEIAKEAVAQKLWWSDDSFRYYLWDWQYRPGTERAYWCESRKIELVGTTWHYEIFAERVA